MVRLLLLFFKFEEIKIPTKILIRRQLFFYYLWTTKCTELNFQTLNTLF